MSDVLMLDCHSKQSLAAIRSLGRQGLEITATSHRAWNPGRLSRRVDRFTLTPDPAMVPRQFLTSVERELQTREYDVLLPTNERTVDLVVGERNRFEQYAAVPYPNDATLEVGLDKGKTIEAAREFGVAHPETMVASEVNLDAVASDLGYPVVVKAQRGSGRDGVTVCGSREELETAYRETTRAHGPTQLQEFVPKGDERGVYTFYDESSTLAGVTVQQRIRSKPPEGGSSTVRETVDDPELIELADELLTSVGWQGIAMVEFRTDPRDGQPKLLEINPRFWGSLSLSIGAGVDFPYLLYRLAVGDEVPVDLTYVSGVRGRCLFTDLLQVRSRDDTMSAIGEFLLPSPKPTCHDVVSVDDPLPVLGQVLLASAAARERLGSSDESESRTGFDDGLQASTGTNEREW